MLGGLVIILGALCAVSSGLQEVSKLDEDVEGYLPWYRSKVLQKIILDDIVYSWPAGYLWWQRVLTLRCAGGIFDLTDVKLERASDAASAVINITQPSDVVSAPLGFEGSLRYVFNGCRLDDTKSPNTTQRGSLVGSLRFGEPLDFVYSYIDHSWGCEVYTMRLTMRESSIALGMDTELLTEASDDDVKKIKDLIVAGIARSAQKAWDVLGQGPKCDSSHCTSG